MTDELRKVFTCRTGPHKWYSSVCSWTLHSWSVIHDSTIKRGATSMDFGLNGTPGYTCTGKLSLCESGKDWEFITDFSDTCGIEVMTITVSLAGCKLSYHPLTFDKPIAKHQRFPTGGMLDQSHSNYVLKNFRNATLEIEIMITILRESDFTISSNPTMLLTPSIISEADILEKLKTMFEEKILCDVTFVLGDERLYAHRLVLAARSKVFATMFSSDMKEQTDNTIDITNTTAEVFQWFLKYLYSGEIAMLKDVVEEMIVIADFYDVSDLKNTCENWLRQSLSEETAIRYLILADKLNCKILKPRALRFIRTSPTVLEKALLEEDVATVTCLKGILSEN